MNYTNLTQMPLYKDDAFAVAYGGSRYSQRLVQKKSYLC